MAESENTQCGTYSRLENPQRPYVRLSVIHREMIWSDLHGDMQAHSELLVANENNIINRPKVAKFLVG